MSHAVIAVGLSRVAGFAKHIRIGTCRILFAQVYALHMTTEVERHEGNALGDTLCHHGFHLNLAAFGTRIGLTQLVGLVVSFIGVAVLVTKASLSSLLAMQFNSGDLLMLVACVCYAAYTVGLSRRLKMPPALMLSFFAIPASMVFAVSMGVEYWVGSMQMPGPKGLAIVAYCAIFPSMIAQICFMRGVELAGANRAGFYLNLIPVFSALMAVFILSERLYPYHAISAVMVLGGIFLAERHKSDAARRAG